MNDHPTTHETPDPPGDGDRTVVLIIGDGDGWTIDDVVNGVVYRTPKPLSVEAAADSLRTLLPGLLDPEPKDRR